MGNTLAFKKLKKEFFYVVPYQYNDQMFLSWRYFVNVFAWTLENIKNSNKSLPTNPILLYKNI